MQPYPLASPAQLTRLTAPPRISVWTEEIGLRNLLPAEPGELLVGPLGVRYIIVGPRDLGLLTALRRWDVEDDAPSQ